MKMTGARILVETLIEQGVDTVFGYPGGQVLNIYDELYQNSDRLRHVLAAHEQGAAHAADGYSRATGKVGVVIATSGPGATNLVTGIATAMLDSVPMVAITGNVPCDLIGRDSFQEIDITGITLPITKHNYFVQNADDLADVIREAFKIAKSGRPGPVLIDIPKDVQINLGEYEKQPVVEPFPNKIAPPGRNRSGCRGFEKQQPSVYLYRRRRGRRGHGKGHLCACRQNRCIHRLFLYGTFRRSERKPTLFGNAGNARTLCVLHGAGRSGCDSCRRCSVFRPCDR